MFTYKFIVRTDRSNDLRLRITNNRVSTQFSMGVRTTKEELELALTPRGMNMHLSKLIATWEAKIKTYALNLADAMQSDKDVKEIKQELYDLLIGRIGERVSVKEPKPTKGNFTEWFQKFIDSKANPGTKGIYKHTLDRIRLFDSDIDMRNFEDIGLQWLTDFEAFCARTACKNARNIHLRNIRAVFNNAIDYEITTAYPFRRFKIRPEATRKRSMSVEELRKLFDYPVETYAEIYRDCFKLIFMLIGINSADLWALKSITRDGRIEYKRAKTGRLYSIKVEPEALEIINKYRGKNGLLCIADRWSDSRNFRHQCNKALQRIGQVERKGRGGKKIITAEFEGVSTYWARHTWATIAADLDIPDAVIAEALGHSSPYTTTTIYINRNRKKVDDANRRVLDWVLYGKR